MPHQRTTGLTATQFATLLKALTHHLTWVKPDQKPHKLTLTQALKITLISYRHHLTQEALAHLFEVSQPAVSRTISTIEKALEKVLTPLAQPLQESLKAPGALVVDGTLSTHLELALTRQNKLFRQAQESWFQSPSHLHPGGETAGHHWPSTWCQA